MESFQRIYERAVSRHGEDKLQARLPDVRSADELRKQPDHRALAAMARCIFRAGFAWSVIDKKWPGFENAFHGFDIGAVMAIDDAGVEKLVSDTQIVRNLPKIKATMANAWFIHSIASAEGSFGQWLADWPVEDTVGLWAEMKKRGQRLGGNTGPMVLRELGRDTFVLSSDVVTLLKANDIISRDNPTSKRDLQAIQAAFNQWRNESGRPLAEISRIGSCSVDAIL